MDTRLIAANPAEVDTECLVVFALDHSAKSQGSNSPGGDSKNQGGDGKNLGGDSKNKDKPEPRLAVKDAALEKAVADLVSSGEITGKAFETAMLHRPQGLNAKRLLVVGAGKAKSFSHAEARKAAGSAVRALKPKAIKSCAFVVPELASGAEDAVRAMVEGALVADFDPDTYRSDRKDQSVREITVVAPAGADVGSGVGPEPGKLQN